MFTISLKAQNNNGINEVVAFLKFASGYSKDDGSRSYDTKNAIYVKFNLLEFSALGKALLHASNCNGDSTYVKYSDGKKFNDKGSKKKVTLAKQYLTVTEGTKYIGIKLTRYEMQAISDDIKQMVERANRFLWDNLHR